MRKISTLISRKPNYFIAAFLALFTALAGMPGTAGAQCVMGGNDGTLSFGCASDQSQTVNQGNQVNFSVVQNVGYRFTTAGTGFDSRIYANSLAGGGGTNYWDQNSNNIAGNNESKDWNSTVTGTIYVGVHYWDCNVWNGTSATLHYQQLTTVSNTTGTSAMCSGSTRALTATLGGTHNNPTVTWSIVAGGGSISGTTYTAGVTSGASQTITIRATVGVCTSDVSFTVYAPSSIGTLSNSGPINFCNAGGDFGTPVTASGYTGSTPVWQWGSSDGTWNNWLTSASSGTCCFPKKTAVSDANPDRIRVSVTNGVCAAATSAAILIQNRYNEAPSSLTVSPNSVCVGYSGNVTLTATFPSATNLFGTVEFSNVSCGGTTVATVAGNGTTTVTAVVAAPGGSVTYYARYNPGTGTSCSPTSCASNSFTVSPTPSTANAGPDQTNCNNGSFTLAGNTPGVGTGNWAVIGGTGSVTTPSSPTSGVTGVPAGGSATVRWTISSGACTASFDDVVLTNNQAATVTPGGPDVACSSASPSAITLSGASVGGGASTGAWSILSGGGTLSNVSQTATPGTVTYTPAANYVGNVVLQLLTNDPDGAGPCTATSGTRTLTFNQAATATAGGPDATCQSATPGAITLSGAGVGGAATTGAWSISSGGGTLSSTAQNTNAVIPTVTYTPAANFTGTVTLVLTTNDPDGAGPCAAVTSTRTINVNPLPTDITPTAQNPIICTNGSTNIQIPLSQSGVSYQLRDDATNTNIGAPVNGNGGTANLPTGTLSTTTTFNVVATNATTSCSRQLSNTVTVTVNVPSTDPSGINGTSPICQGLSSTLSVVGGSLGTGATWQWYSGSCGLTPAGTGTSISVSPSTTTTYFVRAEGSCNNSNCAQFTVTVRDTSIAPTAITGTSPICMGFSSTLSISTGTLGFGATWQWYSGSCGGTPVGNGTLVTVSPTTSTTYFVRAEGTCNNTICRQFTVNVNPLPNGSIQSNTSICFGTSTVLTFNFNSGTAPFNVSYTDGTNTYVRNGVNTGDTIQVAPASTTTYVFSQITDANTCVRNSLFTGGATVTVTPLPVISSVTSTPVLCYGDSTGTITVTASSGTPPFSYSANGGATFQASNIFTGLPIGTYTIVVTDTQGCSRTYGSTITITQPTPLVTDSVVNQDASCANVFDGKITVYASGGTPAYTYSLNGGPPQPGNQFTGLASGVYTVYVIDANGCVSATQDTIRDSYVVSDSVLAQTNVSCFGGNNGSVTVQLSGGVPPYSYSINGVIFQPSGTFTGLTAGNYVAILRDSKGCSAFVPVTITQPAQLVLNIDSVVNVLCNGSSTGNIYLSVTGGTPNYNYVWSNGPTTEDNLNVPVGSYTVTVTDANGCSTFTGATVTQPQPLTLSVASSHNVRCYNDSSGSIDITVGGGVTPYTYTWNNGATTEDLFNINGGTYTVTVQDANGCTKTTSVVISEPTQLASTITGNAVTCNGLNNGNVDLDVTGGTTPYTYTWNNGATTQDLSNVGAGNYVVIVTDAHSCTLINSYNVTQPAALTASVVVTNVLCNGDSAGAINLTVGGGTQPYTYNWSNGATSEDLSNLTAGTYTVIVTDSSGCTATASGTINQPLAGLSGSLTPTDVSCNGYNNGSVNLTISGGTQPYSFIWNSGQTTEDISGLSPGTYIVTVTDINGCQFIDSTAISQPFGLTTSIAGTNVTCFGGTDGQADLTATGGTQPYTYLWSTFANTEDLSNIPAGNYVAIVTDLNGCQSFATVVITQPAQITVSGAVTAAACNGSATGAIDITVNGGVQPYTFAWSTAETTEDIDSLSAGSYTVVVTDSNNCTASATFNVTSPAAINLSIASFNNASCAGASTGYIDVNVSGGVSPYTYLWNTGATSQDLNNLGSGTYDLTVTDANGCTAVISQTITEPAGLTAGIATGDILCFGGTTNVDLTVNGGTGAYAYFWNNGATTEDLTGVGAGTYTVMVTDANGCTTTSGVVIGQPAALALNTTKADVACNSDSSGAIDLTVSGGITPYTFAWSNGAATEDLNNVVAGTYVVVVTDSNNCTATTSVTITQPTAMVLNATPVNVACAGGNNGRIDITVNGGVFPYTYLWNTGATTEDLNNIPGGTYDVTVTDANGCTLTQSFTITEPGAITSSIVGTNVTCNGASNGAADLTVNGGATPYTFLWSNFQGQEDLTNIPGGTYYVIITDANGCTHRDSVIITEPAAIVLATTKNDVACNSDSSGAIDLTVSGGITPYTFAWSNGATTEDLNNVVAGTYVVVVTDSNNCTATTSVTITQPTAMVLNATPVNVACAGGNNGRIDITVNGGVFPYIYLWNTGATTEDLNNIPGGTYDVTVTDANGCTLTQSFTITEPGAITSSIVGTNVTCNGASNGAADLTVNGGATPYTFLWSNFQGQEDLTNIPGGTYYVIITDANGCTHRDSVIITEPAAIVLATTKNDVACNSDSSGAIDLTVSGGITPYTFAWSNGAATEDLNNIVAGTYVVVVTDSNNCTATTSVTITQPTAMVLNATPVNVACAGGNNGRIDITVNGGVFPYTYLWNTGATTEDLNNIPGGTYDVTVTDANGCTLTQSFTITEPGAITSSTGVTNVTCYGASNGSIDLTVNGGALPYSFLWSTFNSTEDLNNIPGGTYFVIVTDANGCNHRDSVVVTEPAQIVISTVATQVLCNGDSTGAVNATVTGGTGTYTFAWSNGAATEDLTGIPAGTYTLLVTDSNNCTATASVTITQPTPISLNATVVNVACAGGNNGRIDITLYGGVGPYTYLWNTGATTEDVSNLAGGPYDVTVTDANGCTLTQSFNVTEPAAITSTIAGTNVTCNGAANGSADVTVNGGQTPYTFSWSNFQATEDVSGLSGGTYFVIITDANGCTHRDSVIITEPTAITLSVTSTVVLCNGAGGNVDLTVAGGTPGYTYLWTNGDTTQDLTGVQAGTYAVTVTDANGCTATISTVVTQPAALTVSGTVINAHCAGSSDGSINLTVFGGTMPYSFNWSNGATTEDIANLAANTYDVTVTDGNGCQANASFTVTEPSPIISSVVGTNVLCQGANNGTADLTVSGGVPGYTFLWSNFLATEDISGLDGGIYYVLITDAAGCTHRDSVIIEEPSPLIVSSVVTNITCFNANNGAVDLSVVGGTTPYTYLWSRGDTTQDVSGLSGGSYTVTITDNHGCTALSSAIIANPSMLASNFITHSPLCFGDANGSIDLIPSGGTPSYTYLWSRGDTTEDINGLIAGTYSVTITDVKGCIRIDSTVITEPGPLYTSGVISNVTCAGLSNGAVIITAYGGTLPYGYNWSGGASTKDIYNVGGGNQTVTVTDANGCQAISLYTIVEPQPLAVSLSGTNVSCYGGNNGTVTATATGGTVPYQYLWEDFIIGQNRTGLGAGHYNIMLTDSNGCQAFDSIDITQPTQLVVSGVVTNVTCNAGTNGAIAVTVTGGVPNYTYQWTPAASTQDLTGIGAGSYSLVVTDSAGCTATAQFTVTEPTAITSQFFTTQPSCFGSNNGSISVNAANGTGTFTYSWNTPTPQTGATAQGLGAGDYTVTITDGAGCSVSASVTLGQPDSISVSTTATGSKCFNNGSGQVEVTVNGGEAPYIYQVGAVSQLNGTFTGLGAGSYLVVVTDNSGCKGTSEFTITSPAEISVSLAASQQVILTGMSTQLVATANSSSPVIGYTWMPDTIVDFSLCSDPQNCNSPYVHPLTTTTFTVVVMNQDSCTASDTITITVNNEYSQFVPNSFSPNGDGLNDRFEFDFLGATEIEVSVFDRWGARIFYDAAQPNGFSGSNGWDGTKDGKKCPSDTYVYQLRVKYYDGSSKDIAGTITLMD